jgi:hypothetical protein
MGAAPVSRGVTLAASKNSRGQALRALAGGLLVILYPNRGSAINPGSTVAVTFGDAQLEPITAR